MSVNEGHQHPTCIAPLDISGLNGEIGQNPTDIPSVATTAASWSVRHSRTPISISVTPITTTITSITGIAAAKGDCALASDTVAALSYAFVQFACRYFIYSSAVLAKFDTEWAKKYNEKVRVAAHG